MKRHYKFGKHCKIGKVEIHLSPLFIIPGVPYLKGFTHPIFAFQWVYPYRCLAGHYWWNNICGVSIFFYKWRLWIAREWTGR